MNQCVPPAPAVTAQVNAVRMGGLAHPVVLERNAKTELVSPLFRPLHHRHNQPPRQCNQHLHHKTSLVVRMRAVVIGVKSTKDALVQMEQKDVTLALTDVQITFVKQRQRQYHQQLHLLVVAHIQVVAIGAVVQENLAPALTEQ